MNRLRKLLAPLLACALLFGMLGTAQALPTNTMQATAFSRLSALKIANGIARGDGTVDPALGESITRAQMMAIIVRAFGAEELAIALKGASPFPDVPGSEWYSGYIAVAKNLAEKQNVSLGRPNGRFDPSATVTSAEVLAFIMKFLGVQRDATKAWPQDYIQGALNAGLITEADKNALLDFPDMAATRGIAFTLADTIFYNYKGLPGNKSIYTTYVDSVAPTITLSTLPEKTDNEVVTVSGQVDRDTVSVTVDGQPANLSPDGQFSANVRLAYGTNALKVEAVDVAGNKSQAGVEIVRNSPVQVPTGPAIAEVKADKTLVGIVERVTLTAYDEQGVEIKEGVTFIAEDPNAVITNKNIFQATQPGRYVIKAESGGSFATTTVEVYGQPKKLKIEAPSIVANGMAKKAVKVTAVDELGTPVLTFGKDGETIHLEGTGVTTYDENGVETAEVAAVDGTATFLVTLSPALAGETVTLYATHEGTVDLSGEAEITGAIAQASGLKVEGIKFLAANKSVTTKDAIKVYVVDQDGTPVQDAYNVSASITGPAALLQEEATYVGPDSPAIFDLNNWSTVGITGTIKITFSVDGVGSVVHVVEHKVAGTPAKLVVTPAKAANPATEEFEVTVEVQDRNGIPVPISDSSPSDVTLSLPNEAKDKFEFVGGDTHEIAAGETSVTFKLHAYARFTGALKLTASGPNSLTGSGTVNIVPGPVYSRGFDKEKAVISVAVPTATFVGFVSDRLGNPVPARDVTLKVYALETTGSATTSGDETKNVKINGKTTTRNSPVTLKTDAEGKVEINVTVTPYADTYYVLVLTDANGNDPQYAHMSVTTSVPGKLEVTAYKRLQIGDGAYRSTTNVKAGEPFLVKVRVTDTWGGPVRDIEDDLRLISPDVFSLDGITLAASSTVRFKPASDYRNDQIYTDLGLEPGDYVAELYGGKAGIQKVTVQYNLTVDAVVASASLDVKPGAFEKIVINDGKSVKMKVNSVTASPIKLALADRFGNPTTTTTRQSVTWSVKDENGDLSGFNVGVRLNQGGINVSEFLTQSVQNFYLEANKVGVYTMTFYAGDAHGDLTVEVEK
jgi:hypothetical protein